MFVTWDATKLTPANLASSGHTHCLGKSPCMQPLLSDILRFQKHTPVMVFRDQRSGVTSGTSLLPATALERGLDVSATARHLSRAPNLVLRTSRERIKCSIDRTVALLATIQRKAALFEIPMKPRVATCERMVTSGVDIIVSDKHLQL
jgi:hypothetical protein